MKIQSINKSINNQNYTAPYAVKRQQAVPHFTGTPLKLSEQIMQELPGAKTLEKLKNAEWLKGEAGSILITALGTGLVAPIFIGFNPFVKAPKNATPEQKQ